jgi:hypothetical protein
MSGIEEEPAGGGSASYCLLLRPDSETGGDVQLVERVMFERDERGDGASVHTWH